MCVNLHRIQADILTDEMFEFIRWNFSQTFKTGNFGILAQSFDCRFPFRIVVAVKSRFFIPHPKEWSLQNKQMTLSNQFRKKLQEKSNQ